MNTSMERLILGPMPAKQFLDEFLPKTSARKPRVSKKLFALAIPEKAKENEMYEPFMTVITDNKLIPGFKMVNTSYHIDKDIINGPCLKPDPSTYHEDLDVSQKVTQFGELELHSELKAHNTDDAFLDPPKDVVRTAWGFESLTNAGMRSRSQLIHYATEWFSRQHRRHAFTVFLFGTYVRFIRWDRAGAIVSERFDFRTDCSYLVEFLWRFSHLDDEGRGKDPFVRRATPEEEQIARVELQEWKPEAERPIVVFTVREGHQDREFIAWGCLSERSSLTGRSTRIYPVYEIATKERYLLKDSWRAHTLAPEAETLRELRDAKVEHIPIYICGGDVDGGVTKTDLYVTAKEAGEAVEDEDPKDGVTGSAARPSSKLDGSWKCGDSWRRIVRRLLHRFLSSVIGEPLKTSTSSKHMLLAVSHAFIGHWQSYERCGIIHRDVSANNILITSSGGILNDWDMAKKEEDIQRSRRHERTGTWEFMSSLLLAGHHYSHTIQDDIESFVLIIIYHALRYFSHNKRDHTSYILDNVFSKQVRLLDGTYKGGEARRHLFVGRDYIGNDFELSSPPLNRWVHEAIKTVKQWITTELAKSDSRPKTPPMTVEERRAVRMGTLRFPLPVGTESAPTTMPPRDLDNHEMIADLFADCLLAEDWPAPADKPYDILSKSRAQEKLLKRPRTTELEDSGTRGSSSKRSKPSASGELEDIGISGGSSSKRSKPSASGSLRQGSDLRRSSRLRAIGQRSQSETSQRTGRK